MNYTYIVECADGTLYTGWTTNVQKRVKAHNEEKSGAKYTKAKRPVKLVSYEGYERRSYEKGICHQAADPEAETGTDSSGSGCLILTSKNTMPVRKAWWK